jgi:DNA-binding SARP family transcriptional activator
VWDLLLPQTKSFDSVIQQETIVKAASNVTKLLNKLKQVECSNEDKCKQDIQSCMDMGMESLALMAQYNKMTNLKR